MKLMSIVEYTGDAGQDQLYKRQQVASSGQLTDKNVYQTIEQLPKS